MTGVYRDVFTLQNYQKNPSKGVELEILVDGLYRNHGFWQTKKGGKDVGYFGSDQGILRVSAPEKRGGQWKTELIMEGHIRRNSND